jgi:hypothetical protein
MVVRIVLVAAVIAATLVVVQQKQVLQNAGLTGYCTAVATPTGQAGYWHECHPGKLTGTPELSRSGSCTRVDSTGGVERWRCETPLEQNAVRQ